MRLHHLSIAAFGPFAGEVEVDFDALGQAGLFLLSGPTGSGKTSVLDAVCFGLYGDVPGDRSGAKRLRSDQAVPGAVPRVVLEATLSGRRLRLVRSPAWERPKKRGAGTTAQPATVTVSEQVGGDWDPLTSRLDEAGDLVGQLLGLSLVQFTQVALLPQGRFATFLRAKSEERHRLLQQLFRTGRFEAVEQWLRDRRTELRRESTRHHEVVAGLLSRVSETADAALPEPWDLHDLTVPAAEGEIVPWATALLDRARAGLEDARTRSLTATEQESASRLALERARVEEARRERLRSAHEEQAGLRARAEDHAHDVRRLDAARRAAPVLDDHEEHETAFAEVERATGVAATSLHRAAEALGEIPVDLEASLRVAREHAAVARAALPRAAQLAQVETAHEEAIWLLDQIDCDREASSGRRNALSARLHRAREQEADAREATLLLQAARGEADDLRERVEAATRAVRLRDEHEAARTAWNDARAETLDRRDTLAALQHARLEGMAAELAGSLAVGAGCPVCGSHEHPSKAGAAPGAPDAAAERTARTAVDDAAAAEVVHADAARVLETRLVAAAARAGDEPVETLERRLHTARAGAAELGARAGRLDDRRRQREAAEAEQQAAEVQSSDLEERRARTEASVAGLAARRTELSTEIEALLAGTEHPTLDALVDHLEQVIAACTAARRAATSLEEAQRDHRARGVRLRRSVDAAGFDNLEAVLSARLDADEVSDLARAVTTHEERLVAVAVVLRELDRDEPDGGGPIGPVEPVEQAARRHRVDLEEHGRARADEGRRVAAVERLEELGARLDEACRAWAPVREDHETTAALASFVEGRSSDNELRMRLSAYVLAYRLTQVVDAANERLTTMSDQRYSLEHTGQRGVGETRGGLSLLVRDDWSGESRDPATLSGGETFVVSLALALGLADVITHESGGAALDTLFVDEGFGSLDADTLDDVMDTLDGLRDGGRVVGVVSHVAEMRDRIPTQLVLTKSRRGSTLVVRG